MSTVNSTTGFTIAQIQSSFAQYILTPLNAFGLGGLVFDVEGETTINLNAEITDHYLESNTTVQDNIAIKPQRVIFKGYAADVVHQNAPPANAAIQKIAQKLTVLNQYLPDLAQQAQQIQPSLSLASQTFSENSVANLLTNSFVAPVLNNVINIWGDIKNLNPGNGRQQQIFVYLKSLFEQKILLSLQTPFEFVTNLAIESITAVQTEATRSVSSFTIELKKIRTATTQTTSFNPSNFQIVSQNEPVQQLGNNQGADVSLTDLPWKTPYGSTN